MLADKGASPYHRCPPVMTAPLRSNVGRLCRLRLSVRPARSVRLADGQPQCPLREAACADLRLPQFSGSVPSVLLLSGCFAVCRRLRVPRALSPRRWRSPWWAITQRRALRPQGQPQTLGNPGGGATVLRSHPGAPAAEADAAPEPRGPGARRQDPHHAAARRAGPCRLSQLSGPPPPPVSVRLTSPESRVPGGAGGRASQVAVPRRQTEQPWLLPGWAQGAPTAPAAPLSRGW